MTRFVLFGPGYAGTHLAHRLRRDGWNVDLFGREAEPADARAALARASHVLSTVPPEEGGDAVLARYSPAIARVGWVGYLSSTGVYGDAGGAWVDESAPLRGRRPDRIAADLAWQALGARVLRLPGIYGPGRSVIDRLKERRAHRIDLPDQVFSRIHVEDIVGGVMAAIERGAPGAYNLADDLPASQNALVEWACARTGLPLPPLIAPDDLSLTPAARAFYGENRRVAAGKARRLLGWRPSYPTWREGLAALLRAITPSSG